MLKETFVNLLSTYTQERELIDEFWAEIEKNYNGAKRFYHTLIHLENLLRQLTAVKAKIQNWDTLLFSLYYHDVIYNALKSNNEEKSAELAVARMVGLNLPQTMIDRCDAQILATKLHRQSDDNDTNYFLDADLSILGQPWEAYLKYSKNVRREYAIYPDLIYKPGRKKVLQHFISMERIYKTDYFFQELEATAKQNLEKELASI
ncbi:MAG: hypothetical protein EOO47_05705 [Flavobacterium sp.]|nr:MAG: hypothetical protein EOO47_05705 [Flavobacterium sp.]